MSFDAFLGGRVKLEQPDHGFRAGMDSVLLAAAIPAQSGESVLELGAGSGVVLCCLGARVANLGLNGVEVLAENVERANRNINSCGFAGEVYLENALEPSKEMRQRQFHHVFLNPPFYEEGAHSPPIHAQKAEAHLAKQPLSAWMRAACKRARPKGSITAIAPAAALRDLLTGLEDSGAIRILPIASKPNEKAKRVLIQVRRQSGAALEILPPLIMYDEQGRLAPRIDAIARGGEELRI